MPERITRIIGEMLGSAGRPAGSGGGETVEALSEKILSELEAFFLDDTVSFTVLGNILLFNDFIRVTEKERAVQDFARRLKQRGIKKVSISRGVTPEEFRTFVEDLSRAEGVPQSTNAIAVDVVQTSAPEEKTLGVTTVLARSTEKLTAQYDGAVRGGLLDLTVFERTAASLVAALRREVNPIRLLSAYESEKEPFAVHGIHTGIFSAFQAEALGLEGQMLQEVTCAGILHDIGTLFLPQRPREEKSSFTRDEWDQLSKHPIAGAMFLTRHRDPSQVSVIVAFEHHMKYDGSGYPETKRRGTLQNVASQIVAIADFSAALLEGSAWRRPLTILEVVGLLRELAGRDFNPELVTSFINRLISVKAI